MAWIMDTYATVAGSPLSPCVTGKPVSVGGATERRSAAGLGVVHCVRLAVKDLGLRPPVRVAVAGYGEVGRTVAQLLARDENYKVVGVSDVGGARYDAAGLPAAELERVVGLAASGLGEEIRRDTLLAVPCDVLVPAATSGVIHDGNAGALQARLVVEAANGPVTASADEVLAERGIEVVPDILANAGGVIASYYEWAQGTQTSGWPPTDIAAAIRGRLEAAYLEAARFAQERGTRLRRAAHAIGVRRVVEAHVARGLYP
jgi:glutamate dehydrogenase (NAD(P)+)